MNIKNSVKFLAGFLRCKHNHLKTDKNTRIYIGKHVKILGGSMFTVGNGVSIRPAAELWCHSGQIIIGEGTDIGTRCRFSVMNSLVIGKNVLFSPNVYITDCDHAYTNVTKPVMQQGVVQKDNRVCIKDGAYIGINAVIVGNVTIGKGSVIGANSVVTKDVPDYCVAVGVPARVIKRYDPAVGKWVKL